MSSCHRALQTCDVIHEVFSWLTPGPRYDEMTPEEEDGRRNARHDLLNVVLVCRAFASPALDVLWRELDDLLPVMQLLTESHDCEVEGLNASGALVGGQEPSVSYRLTSQRNLRIQLPSHSTSPTSSLTQSGRASAITPGECE